MYLGANRRRRIAPRRLGALGDFYVPKTGIDNPCPPDHYKISMGEQWLCKQIATAPAPAPAYAPPPITVSPTIQTNVNPNISPVFQQSYMPSGSPMTAGTQQQAPATQTAPGVIRAYEPEARAAPRLELPAEVPTSRVTTAPVPGAPTGPVFTEAAERGGAEQSMMLGPVPAPGVDWVRYLPWALGGIAALAAVYFLMKGRKK